METYIQKVFWKIKELFFEKMNNILSKDLLLVEEFSSNLIFNETFNHTPL